MYLFSFKSPLLKRFVALSKHCRVVPTISYQFRTRFEVIQLISHLENSLNVVTKKRTVVVRIKHWSSSVIFFKNELQFFLIRLHNKIFKLRPLIKELLNPVIIIWVKSHRSTIVWIVRIFATFTIAYLI